MAKSPLLQRAIQRVEKRGGDSGFTTAKKMADLVIKQNIDSKAVGYEQAIAILEPFTAMEGNAGIDAQRLVQDYTNKLESIQEKKSAANRSIGQFKLDEKNSYYAAATGGKAMHIAQNDIPGLVMRQREALNLNLFQIQEAITAAEQNEDNTAELYSLLDDAHRRYQDIERLWDDISSGNASALNEYGIFVDGDRNGIDGVFIAKTNDLPPGVSKESYAPLGETAQVAGGMIPVFGEQFTDPLDGKKKVVLGNRQWTSIPGGGETLRYDRKSDPTYRSDPKTGTFLLTDYAVKNNPLQAGGGSQYFTGITGIGDDKQPIKTLFHSPDGQSIYSIDPETEALLRADPIEGTKIAAAKNRRELDSTFIRDVVIPNAKPFKMEQFKPEQLFTPIPPEMSANQSTGSGFQSLPNQSFFSGSSSAVNRQTTPAAPVVSNSTPDLIEQGKSFFRKAVSAILPG